MATILILPNRSIPKSPSNNLAPRLSPAQILGPSRQLSLDANCLVAEMFYPKTGSHHYWYRPDYERRRCTSLEENRPNTQIVHWCFDLYPEAAIADGLLPDGRLPSLLRSVMRSAYQRVDLLADIGSCMRQRLSSYNSPARTVTLPPWALAESTGPTPINSTQRAATFGSAKLGLLYSGSFGRAHSVTEILSIARLLRDTGVHLLAFAVTVSRN